MRIEQSLTTITFSILNWTVVMATGTLKNRNHLSGINTISKVNIIDNGLLDIPMLQLLDENGHLTDDQYATNISKKTATKILESMEYTV